MISFAWQYRATLFLSITDWCVSIFLLFSGLSITCNVISSIHFLAPLKSYNQKVLIFPFLQNCLRIIKERQGSKERGREKKWKNTMIRTQVQHHPFIRYWNNRNSSYAVFNCIWTASAVLWADNFSTHLKLSKLSNTFSGARFSSSWPSIIVLLAQSMRLFNSLTRQCISSSHSMSFFNSLFPKFV